MASSAFAQNYVSITDPGSRWLYWHVAPWPLSEEWWPMEIGQDTVLAGSSYKAVIGGPGGLRDEGGKVWFYPYEGFLPYAPDSLPLLLYDFELQVGDSFQAPVDTAYWLKVAERDSVQLLDGSYRGRILFEQGYSSDWGCSSDNWIEGIGDPWFLFLMVSSCFELGVNLECYGINNVPLLGSCVFLGQEPPHKVDDLHLVPLEAYGQYRIDGIDGNAPMTVFDVMGRATRIKNSVPSQVDLSSVAPGIYFLRVRTVASDHIIRFQQVER